MTWRELNLTEELTVFTTARLRWRPLVETEPDGAQIATLWGDPGRGSFGAVVHRPADPPDLYTLIRSEGDS